MVVNNFTWVKFTFHDLFHQQISSIFSVSGFASNPNSWFFIPKVKGQCEELIMGLEFHQLFVYRPGLLRCARNESRPVEYFARAISNFIDFQDFWSISTQKLAEVIVKIGSASDFKAGKIVRIFEHGEIVRIHGNK